MFDVIDAGSERAFEDRDNTRFHLGRYQAGIGPDDADDRNVDAREDVYRRTEQNHWADQKQHQREHDERVRARESKFYDPHKQSLSWRCMGLSSFLATIAFWDATTAPMARRDLRVSPWH